MCGMWMHAWMVLYQLTWFVNTSRQQHLFGCFDGHLRPATADIKQQTMQSFVWRLRFVWGVVWMHEWIDGWTSGWMEGWVNTWSNTQMQSRLLKLRLFVGGVWLHGWITWWTSMWMDGLVKTRSNTKCNVLIDDCVFCFNTSPLQYHYCITTTTTNPLPLLRQHCSTHLHLLVLYKIFLSATCARDNICIMCRTGAASARLLENSNTKFPSDRWQKIQTQNSSNWNSPRNWKQSPKFVLQ